jgi:hypothetical protein
MVRLSISCPRWSSIPGSRRVRLGIAGVIESQSLQLPARRRCPPLINSAPNWKYGKSSEADVLGRARGAPKERDDHEYGLTEIDRRGAWLRLRLIVPT